MDPYAFTDTDDGILNAQSALKSLRAILDVDNDDRIHDSGSDASMDELTTQESPNSDEELLIISEDKVIALREQLAGLEDMLKFVMDERFARNLSGLSIEVDEESMGILRRVIRIATDIINSEMDSDDVDDEENALQDHGETPHRCVTRYVKHLQL
jgi:hypothetical protein